MIYITGDTHGEFNQFMKRMVKYNLKSQDLVIICGDFGFIWGTPEYDAEFEKLKNVNFNVAFIDGNHENFDLLESYPLAEWNGGVVHRITDKIVHLTRGQVFVIANLASKSKVWQTDFRAAYM